MRLGIKNLLKAILPYLNRVPLVNQIKLHGNNKAEIHSIIFRSRISCNGTNNIIKIGRGGILRNCKISITGSNNTIEIGENVNIINGDICLEDDGNRLYIDEKTNLCGKVHLAVTEGTTIKIGKECLLSSEIVFRTGDSHAILNMDGKRVNPAKDITLEDRVWVGHRVLINKGVVLPKGTVVGTGAVVTKPIEDENTVIAGNPARIVKRNIQWKYER